MTKVGDTFVIKNCSNRELIFTEHDLNILDCLQREIDKLKDMLMRTINIYHYGCEGCNLDEDIEAWWEENKQEIGE